MNKPVFLVTKKGQDGSISYRNLKYIDGFFSVKAGTNKEYNQLMMKYFESHRKFTEEVLKDTEILPIYLKCSDIIPNSTRVKSRNVCYMRLDRVSSIFINSLGALRLSSNDFTTSFELYDSEDVSKLKEYLENNAIDLFDDSVGKNASSAFNIYSNID